MTLTIATPQKLGLHEDRWLAACALAESFVAAGSMPAIAFQLVRPGRHAASRVMTFGSRTLTDESRAHNESKLQENDIFLVASLTKPIVAMGVLRLVEAGRLALNDRVRDLLPEFRDAAKRSITVRHLLTHTSGLPDMLPENLELRQGQSPLSAFVTGTCKVDLGAVPGHGAQYQSMGYLLLGEIISRVTGTSCAEFLRQEFFEPMGMTNTSLGIPQSWHNDDASQLARIVEIRVPSEQAEGEDWNWNSDYWRKLGAPWGGLLSTVGDLSRFSTMMLQNGEFAGRTLFNVATVQAAVGNRLDAFPHVPEVDRRTRSWGYGWRQNWTAHASPLVELWDDFAAYGHWGATGTLWWLAPNHDAALVLLTSQPLGRHNTDHLRLSNAIAAAIGS